MIRTTRLPLSRAARALCFGIAGTVGLGLMMDAAMATNGGAPPVVPQVHASEGAPNVVVVLLDDVGFAASSAFGGPVHTPTLEMLAGMGLSYNRFHTTGICTPTRASLLTGRNPHAVGVGTLTNTPTSYPGYRGVLQEDSATIAELLRQQGYSTGAFGKWHLIPNWELSPSGPFDRWPTGVGFERFYGFLGGETDQYEPTLFEGTQPVMRPAGEAYHLTEDLADQAIRWMRVQKSVLPDKPFFLYFAPGATHAPLQVTEQWIEPYQGQFDQGWDTIREQILSRQKQLGVVPADTELTPREDSLPAWDSLSADQKRIAARLMEAYAGFLAHTDAQIGRLVQSLQDSGQFDNTLFIYIVGDNGGSAEGMAYGSLNYMGQQQGAPEDTASILQRLDRIGDPSTFAHFPAGWAWALNTPFQWAKTVPSHLGATRNPMVVTWPERIADGGGLRSQFSHVNDIAPTILEAVGLPMPKTVKGVRQRPMDGSSLIYSFADPDAAERHTTQYFEVFGHRAIYHEGWMASAFHSREPWEATVPKPAKSFDSDVWELYDLSSDFSQSRDLARQQPRKLAQLQALFMKEAKRNQVLPLHEANQVQTPMPALFEGRTGLSFYPGAVGIPEPELKIHNRSWTMAVDVAVDDAASGVIAAVGGHSAGLALYLDGRGRPEFVYRYFDAQTIRLTGEQPLPSGTSSVRVEFDYQGEGYGNAAVVRLLVNGESQSQERLVATVPGFFTVDETFDVGIDTGSAAGFYPSDAVPGYPFSGGRIERLDIHLR